MKGNPSDLFATYRILQVLERSKSMSETIIDDLPGVFAFVDGDGAIIRGNGELASLLADDIERLSFRHMSELFEGHTWSAFKIWFDQLRPGRERMTFELSIDKRERPLQHLWEIARVEVSRGDKAPAGVYFRILGHDISELRNKERKLAEIYSNLPLGLMTVGRDGCVEALLSEQTIGLLGRDDLQKNTVHDVLFEPGWAKLSESERRGSQILLESLGKSADNYRSMSGFFPREIFIPDPKVPKAGGRYLGLSYQPLLREGVIDRLLVAMEDRTATVLAKEERDRLRAQEDQEVRRVIEAKKCPAKLVQVVVNELSTFGDKLKQSFKKGDARTLLNTMHGLKGNARLAGLASLGDMVHHLESDLIAAQKQDLFEVAIFEKRIDAVIAELKEMCRLMVAIRGTNAGTSSQKSEALAKTLQNLFMKYNAIGGAITTTANLIAAERVDWAIRSIGKVPLGQLHEIIEAQIENAARETAKKAYLEWKGDFSIDQESHDLLVEALTHLATNAIAHGIETPDVRKAAGKTEAGAVQITIHDDGTKLRATVADDGRGIDPLALKMAALKRGIMTAPELAALTDEQLAHLIFAPGFTTAQNVTQISGRGVGLDAVVSVLKSKGGDISVRTRPSGGSEFTLTFRQSGQRRVQKSFVTIADFNRDVVRLVEYQRTTEQLPIEADFGQNSSSARTGMLLIDRAQMLIVVSNVLGLLSTKGHVQFGLDIEPDGAVRYHVNVKKNPAVGQPPAEYELIRQTCENWLRSNSGSCVMTATGATITIGKIISGSDLPRLYFAPEDDLKLDDFSRLATYLCELAGSFGISASAVQPLNLSNGDLVLSVVPKRSNSSTEPQIALGDSPEEMKTAIIGAIDRFLGLVI
jgi:signal transduction histidine kinase